MGASKIARLGQFQQLLKNRLRRPHVSCTVLRFLPQYLRNFTCLVASLDVNSFLKARLVLGQRFKDAF